MKLVEKAFSSPADLWFGYTQRSFWQAYNTDASSPFGESNYEPELMAVLPLNLQGSWAFPLHSNIKGYVQLFTGYGDSLINYNAPQQTIGAGVFIAN